jgi:DNA-binding NarL/FixJ family response regulator
MEEVIRYVQAETQGSNEEVLDGKRGALTPRELDVLRLLVDGLSNQEIAQHLYISQHTAANHVANIMNKIGVDSRTAAATWAVKQGIG